MISNFVLRPVPSLLSPPRSRRSFSDTVVMPYVLSARCCGHFSGRRHLSATVNTHEGCVHAHLSIQFVPKPARPPVRSPAHHHCPYRLRSRSSLISHGSAARLVCGPFDPPAFRSGDLANPRETGCESDLSLRNFFEGRKIDRYIADDVLLKTFQLHLFKKLRIVYSD